MRRHPADVAVALDDAALLGELQPSRRQARSTTITTPAPVASRQTEPPIETGFPVTISGRIALDHRVRVHDPGHGLLVRGHVRSRDVLFRPDHGPQLDRVAAGHPLQLGLGHLARVAADAALRAAVGNPQQRALPGHPHRERRALAERDVRVVAEAALRRAEDGRVLDPVAGEHLQRPVVAAHRTDIITARSGYRSRSATSSSTSACSSPCSNCASAMRKSGESHSSAACSTSSATGSRV